MSKKGRDLTTDEKKLWRRVADTVKPRPGRKTDAPIERDEQPAPPPRKTAAAAAPSKPKPAPPAKKAPPQNRANEKRVRRGKLEIGGSLDLHGHTQESGRAALARFVRSAQARGDATVIVITGVGRGGDGVLKRRLPEWLAEPELRAIVSGFAPAHRSHGGAGAFYLFLRRARATEA